MKLYTEEQITQIIEKSRETGLTAEYLMLTIHPIELPSDEEIIKEASYNHYGTNFKKVFENGAKWVIDNIKKQ